jgi:pSer/pThr/pTyr-binding forkhead associated (FHA) protein
VKLKLVVTSGPHAGTEFEFEEHDSLLVGRSKDARIQIADDPYLSRRHFLVEVNPPRCRVRDLDSHSGVKVNGIPIGRMKDVVNGDVITAGHTTLRAGS